MTARRTGIIALWLACAAAAAWLVMQTRYITDLSAFLPAHPTPAQRLLVEQLRDGPASRLILIGIEGADTSARARVSIEMARRLRAAPQFSSVENGESQMTERTRDFVFRQRYLLSDAITEQHFSVAGLRSAIESTIDSLASSSGLLLKSLVPRDPTGETMQIIERLGRTQGPLTQNGVWVSADGARTLLALQTNAAGSDTDAEDEDLKVIRRAFRSGVQALGDGAPEVRLRMSGSAVFAVAARAHIKQVATRLSIVSSVLVITVLLAVYRSMTALALGLLPVATGALVGIAAVALGFGAVHGITLGFGATLIGESVDYSIYFFIQSQRAHARSLWPTIRLGMLTSICGFASLLPSEFPGLAQLGLYSISGLIAAALVTRFVVPELLPRGFAMRNVSPMGEWLGQRRDAARRLGGVVLFGAAAALAATAIGVLYLHGTTLWNRELAALSPLSQEEQRLDATLRSDLGAADVLDLVIVSGPDLEAALRGAEGAARILTDLAESGALGDFETPTDYLPSKATQLGRRHALPDRPTLTSHLRDATRGLDLTDDRFLPFLDDVEAARLAPLLTAADLRGTSLEAGFSALILPEPGRWHALLPLHGVKGTGGPSIDAARIAAALAQGGLQDAQLLNLKLQMDTLYAGYLREALRLSLCGFAAIVLLLVIALRSPLRAARVLAPLILAVLTVAATLVIFGRTLTLLHLVGLLLTIAVGSNYALFFDDEGAAAQSGSAALTLASLALANLCTVIGFGLLSLSQVPVLTALGETVAPGAFLALIFSAVLTSRNSPRAPHA